MYLFGCKGNKHNTACLEFKRKDSRYSKDFDHGPVHWFKKGMYHCNWNWISANCNHFRALKNTGETFTTNYELNETLYAKAEITPSNTVYLWLGANVMLEYTTDEAIVLLTQRLSDAKESLATCEEDLEFLRENITTMEVNTARVYNWDVQKRIAEKEAKK